MKTLLLTLAVLVLAACGGPPGGVAGPASPDDEGSVGDYDGAWQLVSGRGPGGEIPMVEGSRITLTIDGTSIGGTSACNSYGAEAVISGSSFTVRGIGGTEMACEPRVMDSEQAYVSALAAADTIERDGDVLVLSGPNVELTFEANPPPPTADLVGTRWQLESLLEGDGPDGTASSASSGFLELSGDGTLTGSTGCRDFAGEWTERGDEILFTSLSAEGECPTDLQSQDGHVLGVLGDGFTAEVDGDVLTIQSGTLGLQYRAP